MRVNSTPGSSSKRSTTVKTIVELVDEGHSSPEDRVAIVSRNTASRPHLNTYACRSGEHKSAAVAVCANAAARHTT
jgi:hypothetical protein